MKVSGADGQLTALGVSEGRPEIRLPGGTVLGSAALLVGDMQGFDLFAGANQPGESDAALLHMRNAGGI